MLRSAPGRTWAGLGLRSLWALILVPPALATLYAGPPYSDALFLIVGGLGAWEWSRLCGRGAVGTAAWLVVAAVLAALVAASLGQYAVAGWLAALGAVGGPVAARGLRQSEALWHGVGAAYLSACGIAFVWLRAEPEAGRDTVLWLVAVVWATDIGAYFAGRAIGGPKLAPAVSPGKTWAGLYGGVAAAALVGIAAAGWLGIGALAAVAAASMALALIAQLGDLFVSSLKRRFGAKDSSGLIPGHGGILDRVDGLLSAALALGAVTWLMGNSI